MRKLSPYCLGTIILLGLTTASYGQINTTEGGTVPGHGRVNAVNEHQQTEAKLIADGLRSGQLTDAQAEDFKRRMNEIQSEKTGDMTHHHGHLSKLEMKDLERKETDLESAITAAYKKN